MTETEIESGKERIMKQVTESIHTNLSLCVVMTVAEWELDSPEFEIEIAAHHSMAESEAPFFVFEAACILRQILSLWKSKRRWQKADESVQSQQQSIIFGKNQKYLRTITHWKRIFKIGSAIQTRLQLLVLWNERDCIVFVLNLDTLLLVCWVPDWHVFTHSIPLWPCDWTTT